MDWPMYRRVERQASRMHRMMERLDVDPGILVRLHDGDAYAEARRECLLCVNSDACLRWLDQPASSGRRPEFCPRLPLFEACKRSPAGSADC